MKVQLGKHYHIYLNAQHTATIFPDEASYRTFLQLYLKWVEPIAETFAYCLLPNHFHFFVKIKTLRQQIETWYFDGAGSADFEPLHPANQFGRLWAESGLDKLIQTSLTCIPVRDEMNYPHLVRYIHQNPTLHGISDNFRVWHWSSYKAILAGQPTKVQVETVLSWFYGVEWFDEMHWEKQDELKIGYLILED